MRSNVSILNDPVLAHAHRDFAALRKTMTVDEALAEIRRRNPGDAIVYFYVTDEADRLEGVLPTRRLLTAPPDRTLDNIMVSRVLSVSHTATVLEACDFFVMHKLLAFPVVDEERRLLGTIDAQVFTNEVFDLAEKSRAAQDVFDVIGFHAAQAREVSPLKAFWLRFPWLMATVGGGVACAVLSGFYEATLASSVVLAFFLALVLGLGESVCIQSVALTIQSMRAAPGGPGWYWAALRRESGVALLLGASIGAMVFLLAWVWRGSALAGAVIGGSVLFSVFAASIVGLTVPALLRAWKLDPKVAAGPVALALADISTLLFYFNLARWLLGR
jgi:magnesium transporter